jgi:Ala-tRNA(Pro) deacylase
MSMAAETTEREAIPSGSDRVIRYLADNHAGYELHRHRRAFTATEVAASEHVGGARFAKVVIVVADDRLQMVVLPATSRVDLEAAAGALSAAKLRLAHEEEFAGVFPDCEPGAMPAFGNLYGLPVWVDELLASAQSISINAGSHGLSLAVL